jgi:preprotein translocase subunit SecD
MGWLTATVIAPAADAPAERNPSAAFRPGRRTAPRLVQLAAAVALGGAMILGCAAERSDPLPTPSEGPSARPGTTLTYEIGWTAATPFDDASLTRLVDVVRRRLDATGVVGATVRAADQAHLIVTIPAGTDPNPIRRTVGQRGTVTFVPLGTDQLEAGDPVDPARHPALFGSEGVADARVAADQQGGRVVEFGLTPAATSVFGDFTAAHIGEYFAIVLDDKVLTAPVIHSEIPGGVIQISKAGGYQLEEARELVTVLLGPLPAAIREISVVESTVDPSLTLPPTAAPSG